MIPCFMCGRFKLRASLPLTLLLCTFLTCAEAIAQTKQRPTQKSPDEVVRVYTELVQTDVMVFDKQGRFVDGLTKENFELRIDGKPRPIQAFETITAGSDEEAQLAAARGATTVNLKRPVPLDRGRIVFFFLDDFHMDLPGLRAAKKVIAAFLDKQMGQNDQAAIASATGQLGFLQQLTNDRQVLRTALDRLTPHNYSVRDIDRPPMSEYEALLIDRNDRGVLDFFINETMRLNPGITRPTAEQMVRNRAQVTTSQSAHVNFNMLTGLESLVRSARKLPGRKVVFLLSGGFMLENRRGDTMSKLRNITNAAAKNGVVIYSMDTRGLVATLSDASSDLAFDLSGQLQAAKFGEVSAMQDAMHALAVDTGGKALFNTNDLTQGIAPAIRETSKYYLLAWKPDLESQKQGRFRNLEVKLVGRGDLTVRVRKGFFDLDPPAPEAASNKKPDAPPAPPKIATVKLKEAISAAYPERALPILMSVDYYDIAEKGPTLSTAIQVPGEFLSFGEQPDGKIQAVIDLSGVYFDDKGSVKANFMERIVTTAPSLDATKNYRSDITFTYPTNLPPGLYQVRAAARDDKSGRVGSAHAWIEIPDLAKKKLAMSSLLLGERTQTPVANVSDTNPAGMAETSLDGPVALSASHRFGRDSTLRFLLFAYNTLPSPADQKLDVAVQVQVIRDDQPVITTAVRKISTDGLTDLARLPYAAEIPMNELLPGRYLLKITIIDRVAKQSTTRETHFDVY
ncbi:MAG: VWA domain-containing protein [Acidobacteria bacterium]|nr:VWA domain-containing protein [Acidobacteriota bacterium]